MGFLGYKNKAAFKKDYAARLKEGNYYQKTGKSTYFSRSRKIRKK